MTAVVVMLAAGLWRLGRPALWADELATVGAAKLSWSQLGQLVKHVDMVIAPYYVLMHLWIQAFGDSAIAVRIPSVMAMSATAGFTADIATRFHGRRAGFLASAIFISVPAMSRFAQEARPYALGILAVVAATWVLVRSAERPMLSSDLLSATLVATAGILQPAFLMALPGLLTLRLRTRDHWVRWVVLAGLAAMPGVAMFAYSAHTNSAVWDWIRVLPWRDVPYRASSVTMSREGGGALLILGCLGLRTRWAEISAAMLGLFPIAALLAAGMVQPVYTGRLLTFTIPALAILGAGLLARLSLPAVLTSTVAFGLMCLPVQFAIRASDGHGQASRDIVSIIGPRYRPGDVAVYGQLPPSIAWSPRDIVTYYLPTARTPRDALALAPQRTDGNFLAPQCADLPRCLGLPERIWVIRADNPADARTGLPGDQTTYLRANYRAAATFRRAELTVALLVRNAAAR